MTPSTLQSANDAHYFQQAEAFLAKEKPDDALAQTKKIADPALKASLINRLDEFHIDEIESLFQKNQPYRPSIDRCIEKISLSRKP